MSSAQDLDVVVIGNVGIDTNVYLSSRDIDLSTEGHFAENLDCVGQAGGYASLGYARLGRRTAFIGHVGDDMGGELVRDTFARAGIDTSAMFIDPAGTARSVNLMAPDGTRRSFYDGKGHMQLEPDMGACRAVLERARIAHFNIPDWARRLLPVARARGLTIVVDVQDAATPEDAYRRDFIEHADIVFVSAARLGSPEQYMKALIGRNPQQIVIAGMGAAGCVLGTAAGIRSFPAVELDVPVIDTNGAGDSLAVGFVTSYVLDGYPLEAALRRGQTAARWACTLKSTSATLITRVELDRYAGG